MYKGYFKRLTSLLIVVVLTLSTIISSAATVSADYRGDMISFITPEEILGSIPKYNGNPFSLPNPLDGLTPSSPAI